MKRNALANAVTLAVPLFLAGCATTTSGGDACKGCATTIGTAACNGAGQICWVHDASHRDANAGVFLAGGGCEEICKISARCDGRVEAIVNHRPLASGRLSAKVHAGKEQVAAICVAARGSDS